VDLLAAPALRADVAEYIADVRYARLRVTARARVVLAVGHLRVADDY
jgi:hypothetical protein